MAFYSDAPDVLTPVVWYFVPDDRPSLPFEYAFGSLLYDRDVTPEPRIGERYDPHPYSRGEPPYPVPKIGLCGTPKQWRDGASVNDPLPALQPGSNVPVCCGPVPASFAGGLGIGGQGQLPPVFAGGLALGGVKPPFGRLAGGLAIGGSFRGIPPLAGFGAGGLAIGGKMLLTLHEHQFGGLAIGGKIAGGHPLGGVRPGGLAIGGQVAGVPPSGRSASGGLAIGGQILAWSPPALLPSGGLAIGGLMAGGGAPAPRAGGGLAIGGQITRWQPSRVRPAGGLAIGGTVSAGLVTDCCPGVVIPNVLHYTISPAGTAPCNYVGSSILTFDGFADWLDMEDDGNPGFSLTWAGPGFDPPCTGWFFTTNGEDTTQPVRWSCNPFKLTFGNGGCDSTGYTTVITF